MRLFKLDIKWDSDFPLPEHEVTIYSSNRETLRREVSKAELLPGYLGFRVTEIEVLD